MGIQKEHSWAGLICGRNVLLHSSQLSVPYETECSNLLLKLFFSVILMVLLFPASPQIAPGSLGAEFLKVTAQI